jgi:hypothetical protein
MIWLLYAKTMFSVRKKILKKMIFSIDKEGVTLYIIGEKRNEELLNNITSEIRQWDNP